MLDAPTIDSRFPEIPENDFHRLRRKFSHPLWPRHSIDWEHFRLTIEADRDIYLVPVLAAMRGHQALIDFYTQPYIILQSARVRYVSVCYKDWEISKLEVNQRYYASTDAGATFRSFVYVDYPDYRNFLRGNFPGGGGR